VSLFRRRLSLLRTARGMILAIGDLAALAASFLTAGIVVVLFSELTGDSSYGDLLTQILAQRGWQLPGLAGLVLAWCFHRGHYGQRLPFWTEVHQIAGACLFLLLVDGFLQYALKSAISRLWLVPTWILAPVYIMAVRQMVRRLMIALGSWDIPVLLVASPERLDGAAAMLRDETGLGYSVAGRLSPDEMPAQWHGSWSAACSRVGAQLVVLSVDAADVDRHRDVFSRLALERLPFVSIQPLGGLPVSAIEAHHLVGRDVLLLSSQGPLARPLARVAKQLFDHAGAALLLLALSPVLLLIAALLLREGRPVLYAHRRIGRDGEVFGCLKFRTMVPGADAVLEELLARDPAARTEWDTTQKLRDDPRVTPLGRFLRTFSLDELPQLMNVLKGEMSLVGPRPVTQAEAARFGAEVAFYHEVKPGITGLWQVSGRNELDYAERTKLNSWYAKNWSLWLDVVILLRTLPAVLGRRGAS